MESTLTEVEAVGWKEPIRSGAAETTHGNTRGRGASAGPQPGMEYQLNTDRAKRAFPITGALPKKYISEVISVDTMPMPDGMPGGVSKVITKVGLLNDRTGYKQYFYAFAPPAAIVLVNNTSEGHQDHACLRLTDPNMSWIKLRDVEDAAADISGIESDLDREGAMLDKSNAGIALLAALVGRPRTEYAIKNNKIDAATLEDLAVTMRAHLGGEDPTKLKGEGAREKAFTSLRLNGHVDVHNEELRAAALRLYAASTIIERSRERKYSLMFNNAADTMRQEGGIEIGSYVGENGDTTYGFKVFERDTIRSPIRKYIRQAAVATAYGMGKPFTEMSDLSKPLLYTGDRVAGTKLVPTQEALEYIEQVIAKEEERLHIIREESSNYSHNGVISFNDLATKDISDTPPMDDAAIAPAMFYAGAQSLQHYLNQQQDARTNKLSKGALSDLQDVVKRFPHYTATWKHSYMKTLDEAINTDAKERQRRGDKMLASDETVDKALGSWLNLITAYSNNRYHVDEANARNTTLDGWTIAARKDAEGRDRGQINYAFIPPLHTGQSREALITRLKNEGFEDFHRGEDMGLEQLLRVLYVGAREQRAKIVTRPIGSIALMDALDAADNYATNRDSNTVSDLKSKYSFDERLLVKGMTTEELLKHNAQDLLNTSQTVTGREYLNTAKEITDVFKQVFMRVQGTESAARVLMELGEIHLPDLKRTVLFGPGGELYEIKGTDPVTKKTNLEAIPVRVFARDSLYYKVLDRLQRVAAGTAKENDQVTLLGAFKLTPGEARAQAFRDWAEPLLHKIAKHQRSNVTSGLQGLALYSNLSDILGGGFTRASKGYTTTVQDTGAASALGATGVYKIVPDDAGARDAAQDAYKHFTEHLRATYAQLAISEDQILKNPAFQDEGLQQAVRLSFSRESAEHLRALEELAPIWRNMEAGLGNMLGKDSSMRKAVIGQLELERQRDPHLRNSMLTKLTNMAVQALSNLYARFVTGLASTFNLFNPVNIVNSARSALLETIVDAFGYAFSMFVTNFVNKHFKETPTGKKVATSVLDSLQIRVMRPTEMRLLGRLRGSTIDTHDNEHSAIKAGKLRATFQNVVPGYYRLSPTDRDAASYVFSLPELGMRRKDSGKYDDPEFEVQYYVKNRDAFSTVSGGYSLEQLAGSRETLNRWWARDGHKMLFPTSMEVYNPTLGKNVNVIDSSMITAARLMDDPSRFVHIDGDTIRIGMKTTAFGIDPRDVFGDKRTLARERKKYASGDDLDTRTENRMEKQRQEEARKRARADRGTPSDMLSGAANLDGSTSFEDITGANPQRFNTDTGEHDPADVFKHRGTHRFENVP